MKQGRVYHLLVDKDLHAPGRFCENCGAILVEDIAVCPYCSHELTQTSDAVNMAIQQAVGAGLKVSVLDHDSRLPEVGGIAALLRY